VTTKWHFKSRCMCEWLSERSYVAVQVGLFFYSKRRCMATLHKLLHVGSLSLRLLCSKTLLRLRQENDSHTTTERTFRLLIRRQHHTENFFFLRHKIAVCQKKNILVSLKTMRRVEENFCACFRLRLVSDLQVPKTVKSFSPLEATTRGAESVELRVYTSVFPSNLAARSVMTSL
jgi:hypothetical protein